MLFIISNNVKGAELRTQIDMSSRTSIFQWRLIFYGNKGERDCYVSVMQNKAIAIEPSKPKTILHKCR